MYDILVALLVKRKIKAYWSRMMVLLSLYFILVYCWRWICTNSLLYSSRYSDILSFAFVASVRTVCNTGYPRSMKCSFRLDCSFLSSALSLLGALLISKFFSSSWILFPSRKELSSDAFFCSIPEIVAVALRTRHKACAATIATSKALCLL